MFNLKALFLVLPLMLSADSAIAQSRGLNGNYVGVGQTPDRMMDNLLDPTGTNFVESLLNETKPGEVRSVEGRWDVPLLPVSVRGSLVMEGDRVTLEPTFSYDLPVTRNGNIFVGAGYRFVNGDGNQAVENTPVVTAGVESSLLDNFIVYGKANWELKALQNGDRPSVNLQMGAGLRF